MRERFLVMQSARHYKKLERRNTLKWEILEKTIKKECLKNHKSSEFTAKYLEYAKKLYNHDLPIISSSEHLSLLIGIEYQYLCNMAYASNQFYRHFSIPKKNGSARPIDEPLPDLKYVQSWILNNILEKCPVSVYAKAYVKGRTLKSNARFHKAQKVVVTMDIKNFFPSISLNAVIDIFDELGYFHDLSCFLAHLCCLNNSLPQGAPTSPYLSNLRMIPLDKSIKEYTSSRKIRYTRYADDLTFSGDFNPHQLIRDISRLVFEKGFSINADKTRVARSNTRQEVTGIVVNSHMQISKTKRKEIRQSIYYIKKYGLESHLQHIQEYRSNYLNHLLGTINFGLFVNPNDHELKEYFDYVLSIIKEE